MTGVLALAAAAEPAVDVVTAEPGSLFVRTAVLILCLIAIALVAWYAILDRRPSADPTMRWVLLVAFLILSPLVFALSFGLAIESSKPNTFCDSCHVMNPYVADLRNEDSEHLAAMHYQFRWIADHQCYTCHSDYGLFGDAGAKLAGLRHFWKYYFTGYDTPLKIHGRYNNERCLFCHGPVKSWREVPEHQKNADAIATSETSCIGANCHVSPHPKQAAAGADHAS